MNTQIPKPPRGVGISRRLLVALVGGLILVAILFLAFLHHSTKPVLREQASSGPLNDSEEATSLIQKLQQEEKKPHSPLLILSKQVIAPQEEEQSLTDSRSESLSSSEFKQGADAEISVYQGSDVALASSMNNAETNAQPGLLQALHADNYANQNMQSEKIAFLQSSQSNDKDYLQSKLKSPVSLYELKAGTLIPATLLTGIDSDLPGTITAKVSRDVFDTVSGNYLLIPQGTTLIGMYDSQIAYGQSRILIAWSRLIFPNGESFDLEGEPGVDLVGMAGLHDLTNNHYTRIFGSALLFSAFGAAGQLSQPQTATGQLTVQEMVYAAVGQQMTQTGSQLAEKNMNIQPTIQIQVGNNFNVLLTRDIILPREYRF